MFMHNDQHTGVDYMEQILSYLTLQGWYDVDSATVFNRLSTTNIRQSTHIAHLSRLQTIHDEPFISSVSKQVYHLGETHVSGVYRSIILIPLSDASEDFGIPNVEQ